MYRVNIYLFSFSCRWQQHRNPGWEHHRWDKHSQAAPVTKRCHRHRDSQKYFYAVYFPFVQHGFKETMLCLYGISITLVCYLLLCSCIMSANLKNPKGSTLLPRKKRKSLKSLKHLINNLAFTSMTMLHHCDTLSIILTLHLIWSWVRPDSKC